MNRRLTILILAAIAAIAVTVPAIAAQTPAVAPKLDRKSAVRALAKARLALLTARSAKSESRRASRTAQAALNAANEAKNAKGTPGPAGASAPAVQSGSAIPAVSTESESYVQLSGGPSVTVNVPSSGLIEVWAQVRFEGEGAVALFEDGALMPGQSEFCAPEEEGRALLAAFAGGGPAEPLTLATPSVIGLVPFSFACGSFGPPAPVLFQTTPGAHTYELRYKYCGCEEEVEAVFSQRRLLVGPRL